MSQKFIRPADLAKRYGYHPRTLSNWRIQGKGPAFRKQGERVFYAIEDVEAWERKFMPKKKNTV